MPTIPLTTPTEALHDYVEGELSEPEYLAQIALWCPSTVEQVERTHWQEAIEVLATMQHVMRRLTHATERRYM